MMKKLLLTLALATSFGPSMHAIQEVPAAPVEAPEQNQQEKSTLKKVWNSKERKIVTGSGKIVLGLGIIIAAVPYLIQKNFFVKNTFSCNEDDCNDDEIPIIEEPSRTAEAMGAVKGFFASPFCSDFNSATGFERFSSSTGLINLFNVPFNNFTFPVAAGAYMVASGSKDICKNVVNKLNDGENGEPAQDTDSESFTHTFKKFWNSTPRKAVSAGAKITGGALALTYYSIKFCINVKFSEDPLSGILEAGRATCTGPLSDLRKRYKKGSSDARLSREYTIPFFVGSYLLGSGIRDAVKLKKELADKKEENKDQEQDVVPAQ